MEIFYNTPSNRVTINRTWLLNTWNESSMTEQLNFKFYLILMNLNINSHVSKSQFLSWLLRCWMNTLFVSDFIYHHCHLNVLAVPWTQEVCAHTYCSRGLDCSPFRYLLVLVSHFRLCSNVTFSESLSMTPLYEMASFPSLSVQFSVFPLSNGHQLVDLFVCDLCLPH